MSSQNTSRESNRVRELATEYTKQGYKVTIPKGISDTPEFLRPYGYVPDIVARSKQGNLIVEVKSREGSQEFNQLSRIADLVNARRGWKFVLVLTNPRKGVPHAGEPSIGKARELLLKSRQMGHRTEAHLEASFLFAWSALEAAARLLPTSQAERQPVRVWTFVRDAAMAGLIGRDDAIAVERLFKVRNSILHAGEQPPPTTDDLATLVRIVEELLNEATDGIGV